MEQDWTQKPKALDQGLSNLRKAWQEAVSDKSEGLDSASVFKHLEKKYSSRAKAKGLRKP
jgi:hypothetical protein